MFRVKKTLLVAILIFAATGVFLVFKDGQEITPENSSPPAEAVFGVPINNSLTRITKKPFGLFVTPENSPMTPEKFTGYHTGVDFETFSTEQNEDIFITTICEGGLLEKRWASGYGGVVAQECQFFGNPIIVVYGHLKLSSVTKNAGEILTTGEILGVLGQGFSVDTDGERKHLHLGIHKGDQINLRGYVQTEGELDEWINLEQYLK
jgi:hypothetical protein